MSGAPGRRLAAIERAVWDAPGPARATRVAFRVAFFAVLAIDAYLGIAHAARYGAGDFNVSHLPALDGVLPVLGRRAMIALLALQVLLALRLALGAAGRGTLITLTALFGATYFTSQLDSYQHHYLIFLVLVALAARPGRLDDDGPGWPFRLVRVQLSIVYAWAAVAKLAPAWRSGGVLAGQVHEPWLRGLIEATSGFAIASAAVVALELGLAVAIQFRRLRPFAAPLGLGFHLVLEVGGFKIGLFSYFMGALYLLVLPDGWLPAAAAAPARLARRAAERASRLRFGGAAVRRAAIAFALAAGAGALVLLPFPEARWPIAALGLGLAAIGVARHRAAAGRIAGGHLLAALILLVLARTTDVAVDHYRYLGGAARRLGDLDGSIAAYRRVTELAPDDVRGWVGLARAHERAGHASEAYSAAAVASGIEPGNEDARAIISRSGHLK